MNEFFDKGIELSNFDIQRYTAIRGKLTGEVFEHRSGRVPQMYSRVHFCPHSVTHMDLPWCLSREELKLAQGSEGVGMITERPEEIIKLMEYYSKICSIDTVILDLSSKAEIMKTNYLDNKTGCIYQDMNENDFEKMMQFLEIKRDPDICTRLSEEEIRGRFLIVKTNWDIEFNLYSFSLDHPFFELRHPYVTYPFLSFETIKWLVKDLGVAGIGCETSGIENPIYYTTDHFVPNYASKYLNNLSPKFRPVSMLLLTNTRYYIKHLTGLSLLKRDEFFVNGKCIGKACIIPISLGLRDANLAKVIFFREE